MFSTLLKTNFKFWATFILSSANSFDLGLSNLVLFGKELTFYHVIPNFNDSEKERLETVLGTGISPFSHIFIPPQNKCFRGYTGIGLSVCLSDPPSMCLSVCKILLSVKELAGISSHCSVITLVIVIS